MPNEANVHAFGCGRAHPEHGETAACSRQRAHPGDHRSDHDGRMLSWPDPPANPPPVAPLIMHTSQPRGFPVGNIVHDRDRDQARELHPARGGITAVPSPFPPPAFVLDETTEAIELEGEWLSTPLDPVRVLVWLAIVLSCAITPALLVILYRAAF